MSEFRAWVAQFQKMYDVSLIDYEDRTVGLKDSHGGVAIADFDSVVRMKSTGRKDKKGKEIFEGDVVVVLDGMYTVFYDEKTASFRLKPHDKRWHTDYMSNYAHSGSFEVVGNVYQHPEFLEEVE